MANGGWGDGVRIVFFRYRVGRSDLLSSTQWEKRKHSMAHTVCARRNNNKYITYLITMS